MGKILSSSPFYRQETTELAHSNYPAEQGKCRILFILSDPQAHSHVFSASMIAITEFLMIISLPVSLLEKRLFFLISVLNKRGSMTGQGRTSQIFLKKGVVVDCSSIAINDWYQSLWNRWQKYFHFKLEILRSFINLHRM